MNNVPLSPLLITGVFPLECHVQVRNSSNIIILWPQRLVARKWLQIIVDKLWCFEGLFLFCFRILEVDIHRMTMPKLTTL